MYYSTMIIRSAYNIVQQALHRQAAVALIGPRQVGKTTLALELVKEISKNMRAIYLDLELKRDRDKLINPSLFLSNHDDCLVVLDEIHRVPEIFQELRGIIDQGRWQDKGIGRFLILGSASIDLLRQSGESLAGRIEYVNLNPLDVREIGQEEKAINQLWIRGGFPGSYLAKDNKDSLAFRRNFIRTYLERDVAQFSPRIAVETLERFWTMLAHNQGTLLNASLLASSLSVSAKTVTHYVDLLVDLLLVRRLRPFHSNIGKRLVKSPKVYIRDSGILHALLDIEDYNDLCGHPVLGQSWEGFVIENLLAAIPDRTEAGFYRTLSGSEIDLVLRFPGKNELWAIEIKSGLSVRPQKGFYVACEDLKPNRCFVVYAGDERYPIADNIEAIGVMELSTLLSNLSS